jgi:hypothetical protein
MDCWLEINMLPDCPATGRHITGSAAYIYVSKQMLRWFPRLKLMQPAFHAAFQI